MPTALIGPEPIRRQPGPYLDVLKSAGFTVVYPEGDGTLTADQLRTMLPEADVVMAGGERYTAELMDLAPKLKILARTGVGYDAIDVPAATARNIAVTIAPGTNQESVAEQAFALLLAVRRKVVYYDVLIRAGRWERDMVSPVRGLTLGIVGMGRIGRAMVPRALAFGMNVIVFDAVQDPEFDLKHGLQRRGFEELLAESDVVSLHIPATPETDGLFNKATFAKMKRGSVLINTARGTLVNEDDLLDALNSGQLSGAGLDVFRREPPDMTSPLIHHSGTVCTPHLAGIDTKSMSDMATLAAQCMVDVYQGRWPVECMVNREIAKTS